MNFYCSLHQRALKLHKIRRFIKGIVEEWFENISKEMSVIWDKFAICGLMKYLQRTKEFAVKPLRSRLEAIQRCTAPTTVKGMQKFCREW